MTSAASSAAFEFETPLHESWRGAGEAEAFYESVASAARAGRSHAALGRMAMRAARAALVEGRGDGRESELYSLGEAEWEVSPAALHQSFLRGEAAPSATLMEHLGHAASEAESEGEQFAFLAPLLPLALKALPLAAKVGAKLLPKAASLVAKAAPKLLKGVRGVAKTLASNPATKPLVQAIPQIVRKTTVDLARQVAAGKPMNSDIALRTLARDTAQVLGNPRAVVQTLARAKAADRSYHSRTGTPAPAGAAAAKKCGCHCR
jgi:hypothetical protein